MEQVIIELTNVRQLESGEYQATMPNGKSPSGIAPGNERLWPSIQAHLDAGKEVEAYVAYVPTYQEQRARAYPAIGDQLDAIIKELNYRRMNGENLIAEMDSIVGLCLAVKKDYPKPEGA